MAPGPQFTHLCCRGFKVWFYHAKKCGKNDEKHTCTNFKQSPWNVGRRKKDQHNQISHTKSIIPSTSHRRVLAASVHLPGRLRVHTDFNLFLTSVQFPTTRLRTHSIISATLLSLQHQTYQLWPVNLTGGDDKQVHSFFLEESFRKYPPELS